MEFPPKNKKNLSNGNCSYNGSLKRKSLDQSRREFEAQLSKRCKKEDSPCKKGTAQPFDWNVCGSAPSKCLTDLEIQQHIFSNDSPSKDQKAESSSSDGHAECQDKEPEVYVLSSDEDEVEDHNETESRISGLKKEPHITTSLTMSGTIHYCSGEHSNQVFEMCEIKSSKIQIGNYTAEDPDKIVITGDAFKLYFKNGKSQSMFVDIQVMGMIKILCGKMDGNFVLFFYIYPEMALSINTQLGINQIEGAQYNPIGTDETEKRIICVVKHMKKMEKKLKYFREVCGSPLGGSLMETLSQQECNKLFKLSTTSQSSLPKPVDPGQTILVYPPPPSKGKISVTIEDYKCLNDQEFLNDIIIDFYLTWLHLDKLPAYHAKRAHFFSSFFYRRLTSKPPNKRGQAYETDTSLSPAERRHARVKSWTKGIDIFEKDFLLVPINERMHWFLAVICFPGLDGPVRVSDGSKVPVSEAVRPTLSRTVKKYMSPIPFDGEFSDRDEADSEDEMINHFEEAFEQDKPEKKENKTDGSAVKQPCILIFDSILGSSRRKIVNTLREYLTIEYKQRKGKTKVFNESNMVGSVPFVPQQPNFSDCGLYVLQYADSFFDNPIKDFRMPIRYLADWFSEKIAVGKRETIANLISQLMDPNLLHKLPKLSFQPVSPCKVQEEPLVEPLQNVALTNDHDLGIESGEFSPIESVQTFSSKRISVNISSKNLEVPGKIQKKGHSTVLEALAGSYCETEDLYSDLIEASETDD